MKKTKSILASALACAALLSNAVGTGVTAFADEKTFSGYVLMNIPYSEFYAAENAKIGDVDAISSATNKVGNYGKAGGSYHSAVTAKTAEDGTVSAVGGENGAKVQGVTWAVKVDSLDKIKALGGKEITDSAQVTTATFAKGKTTSNTLNGYQTLTEAPSYSYYVLDSKPSNYLVYDGTKFSAGDNSAVSGTAVPSLSYQTRWGDVELKIADADNTSDKIVNAMVITAADGTTKGLYHLDQIWASNDIAWTIEQTSGLDGKKITGIRYYCSDKDTDLTDGTVPQYANYVYDYKVDVDILPIYSGTVTGEFSDNKTISVTGLPTDIKNASVTVSSVVGRGETAVVIAENAAITNGVIKTDKAAEYETSYTVVVKSDNYGDISVTVPCEIQSADSSKSDSSNPGTGSTGFASAAAIAAAAAFAGAVIMAKRKKD